jgi:predicted Fe-Mo cluster-binding NifX family protein
MKICITASGQGLEASVDERFGRAPFFVIVDTESMQHETIVNPAIDAGQGAGIAAAQGIARRGVEALLTGFVGPKAYAALDAAGIRIFDGLSSTMNVRTTLKQHTDGLLHQCSSANARKGIPGQGRS